MNRNSAERAFQLILERGYTRNDLSIVMSDSTHMSYFFEQHSVDPKGNHQRQIAKDTAANTLAGALAESGTALFLRTDGMVISGPVASMIVSAGSEQLAGGLVGALTGTDKGAEKIKQYEAGIRSGGILMGIKLRTEERSNHFEEEWSNLQSEIPEKSASIQIGVNTTDLAHHDDTRRLPHEIDQTPDDRSTEPKKVIKQAYEDIQQGMVDTDMHGERGVEEVVKNSNHGSANMLVRPANK
jgi:hypothetical protein